MRHETFHLDVDYDRLNIKHSGQLPTVTTYFMDTYPEYQKVRKRPLIVICPGGGYNHHSPREGEAIAVKMNSLGYNAAILRYSLAPDEYPCALIELAALVKMAKTNADEWNIDKDRIIVAGFSAGGHLAASLSCMWKEEFLLKALDATGTELKPCGALLSYPVITSGEYAHRGSFEKLLGTQYDRLIDEVSLEKRVTKDTVPAFIWHTFEDGSVPVENSLLFAKALRENGVHFELHIFPYGGHGLGLATEETNSKEGNKIQEECAVWPDLFAMWLKNLKGEQ